MLQICESPSRLTSRYTKCSETTYFEVTYCYNSPSMGMARGDRGAD